MELEKRVRLDKWLKENTSDRTLIDINEYCESLFKGPCSYFKNASIDAKQHDVVDVSHYNDLGTGYPFILVTTKKHQKVFKKIKQVTLLGIGSDHNNEILNNFLANNDVIDIKWDGKYMVMVTYIVEVEDE